MRRLLILVAACGGSHPAHTPDATVDAAAPTDPLAPISGTRIRAQRLTTTDGLAAPIGLFDTQLQLTCQIATAEDGMLRCLPTSAALTDTAYSDATCTMPVASIFHGCAAPAYLITSDNTACNAHQAVYQTGGVVTSIYTPDGMGHCVSSNGVPDEQFYGRGAHVDATTFAAFTRQTVSLAPDLQADFWIGSDGAKIWTGQIRDAANHLCYVQTASDGMLRCLPAGTQAFAGFDFADDTCTIPLARSTGETCGDVPALAAVYPNNGTCGAFDIGVSELGAAYTGTHYTKNSGTCRADASGGPFYQLGATVAPTTFPAATQGTGGGTRITFATSVIDGIAVTTSYFYTDHQLAIDCSFQTSADGTQRCLPAMALAEIAYTDAACTQPIAWTQTGGVCPEPAPRYITSRDSGCDGRTHILALGASIAAPATLYNVDGNGHCTTFGAGTISAYAVGPELPASTFAAGTIVTD